MANPNNPGQKLSFRIVDFSGEDPQYPVTELLTGSPQSKGWQSQRFCDWPQHITFQFFGPVRLRQLQFLSHQCKISSKIELFAALPNLKNPSSDTELKFKKLGYLSLDSNERSGYQSRELKTVYIDSPALYLKIVLQKCHLNKFNLFNQVGLIAVGIFGDPMNAGPTKEVEPQKVKYDRLEYETQFDKLTVEKMKDLEEAKARAVEREDFEEAKRIKLAIDRLKHIGAQLQHLEESKARAVKNEDYDSAKIIKIEIDKLRETVAPSSLGRQPTKDHNRPIQQPQFVPEYDDNFSNTPGKKRGNSRQEEVAKSRNMNQENFEPREEKKEPEEYDNRKLNASPNLRRSANQEERNLFRAVAHDEQVIPTMQGNKKQQIPEYAEGEMRQNDGGAAEALTGQNAKFAEPLMPILGEDITCKLFSKLWNNREDALKTIEQELTGRAKYINDGDPGAVFVAIMGAISHTINDKINQVVVKSMSVLQTLLSQEPPYISSKNELMSYIDGVTAGLLEKIGDNNARTREAADQGLISMARHPVITCNYCVNALVKTINPTKHKTSGSIKHIVARLNMLKQLVKEFKINTKDVPYQPVVEYAVDKLENSAPEVRQAASHLLVDIYLIVGGRIYSDLNNVRPNQMELLQKEFDVASGGGSYGHQEKVEEKKPIITTNISPHGVKKGGAKPNAKANSNMAPPSGNNANAGNEYPQHQAPVCEFCERSDRNLSDPKKMDIHLFKECPMLTTCGICTQIVEISQLNKHLLEECDNKKVMRKCPRCKEAVHMDEYKQHTEEMSCMQAQPLTKANRCALCHQDIPPGDIGWKKHLLTEGCPNNERTM